MTSKNFSFKSLVRHNMTSRMWAIALSVLGCLAGLLLPIFAIQQDYQVQLKFTTEPDYARTAADVLKNTQNNIAQVISFDSPFIKLVLIVLATLCGVAMFRYLHDRRQVDFYHALPISRGKLFAVNYISGVLLVLPFYLIVLVIGLIFVSAMGLGGQITGALLAQSILGNIAYFLLNYTVAVLCTVLTGNTIITVLLGIWAQLGIPVLMVMVQCYQAMFYETFSSAVPLMQTFVLYGSPMCNYLATEQYTRTMSVPLFSSTAMDTAGGMAILLYPVVLTIVLGVLSYFLFVRRKSENTGMAVSFRRVKAPIKWFMCIFSGFAFSLIFTAIFTGSSGGMWFGLVFGVVLCHMVVEIIYDFDFKALLHHWKQMIVLAILAVVVVVGIKNDVFGYDNYIPDVDDIASASVESPYYSIDWSYNDQTAYKNQLSDAESIEKIHQLAELSVANNGDLEVEGSSHTYTIYYTLKNGNRVSRRYSEVPQKVIENQMVDLMGSEPYLKLYSTVQIVQIPQTNEEGMTRLEVRNSAAPEGTLPQATLISRNEIQEVIDQLRADQIANAEAHLKEFPVMQLTLESDWLQVPENDRGALYSADLMVYAADTDTLTLIKRLTGVEPVELTHENVNSVEITQYDEQEYYDYMNEYGEYGQDRFMEAHTVTVTDPATIDALLESAITGTMSSRSGFLAQTASYENSLAISAMIENHQGNETWATKESLFYPEGKMPTELINQLFNAQ
ncbi:hypothetical protein B5F17_07795 [Butyricicoccus pullicaecorum]|uniref:Uncharacterized protein n=1 Tax=Butyricicoccus pullicaecorum TaxID=501571 RepID=A0A1Y4L812_9FIRM|nr:hypothetical protein [Butyricicoccus pullicaecorum]OUP52876.1 hypothetical protein B5F17_07795 [Butyricicoccus pullicaecorum]